MHWTRFTTPKFLSSSTHCDGHLLASVSGHIYANAVLCTGHDLPHQNFCLRLRHLGDGTFLLSHSGYLGPYIIGKPGWSHIGIHTRLVPFLKSINRFSNFKNPTPGWWLLVCTVVVGWAKPWCGNIPCLSSDHSFQGTGQGILSSLLRGGGKPAKKHPEGLISES